MGDSTPLPDKDQCAICKTEQGITACTGCQVQYYCGSQHQTVDWPNHKKLCKMTKTSRKQVFQAMEHIKHSLADSGGDPVAYFRSSPVEVEAYLHIRYIFARALIKLKTRAGVSAGLDSCSEIARLDSKNKQNGQTAREFIPGLFLRLGRDQECYDFIKQKCNGDLEESYRCENGVPLKPATPENLSLAHAAMLCLLKLRVLRDLRDLDQADTALGNKLPAELFHESRSYLISSATKMDAARMKAIDKREDLKPYMQSIETDLRHLRGYIDAMEKDYFHAIAHPDRFHRLQPMYQPELPMTELLTQTHDAWAETPGAIALWQSLCYSWDADVE